MRLYFRSGSDAVGVPCLLQLSWPRAIVSPKSLGSLLPLGAAALAFLVLGHSGCLERRSGLVRPMAGFVWCPTFTIFFSFPSAVEG